MSAKTYFTVIRHGETEWNRDGRIQGSRNSDLTIIGKRQAWALGKRFAQTRFDAIYSSDLKRAWETAVTIAGAGEDAIRKDVRLREANMGVFEGLNRDELESKYGEEWKQFLLGDASSCIPEGESYNQFEARILEFFREKAELHKEESIAVITHGGVLGALLRATLEIPFERKRAFSHHNASVNIFTFYNGKVTLGTWGDISHLEGL